VVAAATAVSVGIAPNQGASRSDRHARWSYVQAWSNPSASARRQIARAIGQRCSGRITTPRRSIDRRDQPETCEEESRLAVAGPPAPRSQVKNIAPKTRSGLPASGAAEGQIADRPEPHEHRDESDLPRGRDRDEERIGAAGVRAPQVAEPEEQDEERDHRRIEGMASRRRQAGEIAEGAARREESRGREEVHHAGRVQGVPHPGR
jgi:hypothetical protein